MDEKFMEERETKSFDEQLADDCINALQNERNELCRFIALQSSQCSETKCRNLSIEKLGYREYLAILIESNEVDALLEKDLNYIAKFLREH